MLEISPLNRIILDCLPNWAMLVDVKTRTVLAANKRAIDKGMKVDCPCWDIFRHRPVFNEGKKIYKNNGLKENGLIECAFCLADDAVESGQARRKEVKIQGGVLEIWWVPVDEDVFLHYAVDINQIRKSQAALNESEEQFAQVVNSMRDGLAIIGKDGVLQFTNQAFSEIYQYSREELVGSHAKRLIHSDYNHVFDSFLKDMESVGHFSGETVDVRKDGTTFNAEVRGTKLHIRGQKCLLVVIRDITERKTADFLLKRQEEFYRSLFEKNMSAILLLNPDDGSIFDANPSACEFYGYSRNQLRKMAITEINTLSENEVFEEMQKAKAEERKYFNFTHRLSNRTVRDVEVFSGPVIVGGKTLLCSIIHDISERLLAEKDRERLIGELKAALLEVKKMSGLLPICSSCKKIRDDKGYWNQIETFIREHSDAEFSHGLCPECARKLYPELDIDTK